MIKVFQEAGLAASNATFTGDTDGSDNWAYICSKDSTGTADAKTNYPAFNWVNNYATTYGLTGTYAEGWYMPSTEGTVTPVTQPTYNVTVRTIGADYAEYEAYVTKSTGIAFRETVTFDFKVKDEHNLGSISVKCGNTDIPMVDNKFFTMPAGDVTVVITLNE